MAIPIKETPILTGKAARHFEQEVKKNENRPVSREEYQRAQQIYQRVMQNSKL